MHLRNTVCVVSVAIPVYYNVNSTSVFYLQIVPEVIAEGLKLNISPDPLETVAPTHYVHLAQRNPTTLNPPPPVYVCMYKTFWDTRVIRRAISTGSCSDAMWATPFGTAQQDPQR